MLSWAACDIYHLQTDRKLGHFPIEKNGEKTRPPEDGGAYHPPTITTVAGLEARTTVHAIEDSATRPWEPASRANGGELSTKRKMPVASPQPRNRSGETLARIFTHEECVTNLMQLEVVRLREVPAPASAAPAKATATGIVANPCGTQALRSAC